MDKIDCYQNVRTKLIVIPNIGTKMVFSPIYIFMIKMCFILNVSIRMHVLHAISF